MKLLKITCEQRVKLQAILGSVEGNAARLEPVLAIYRKVKFSEEENKALTVKDNGDGTSLFQWPNEPNWGFLEILLEESEASTLSRELDQFPRMRVADLESPWLLSLKSQLKAASVEPLVASKSGKGKTK